MLPLNLQLCKKNRMYLSLLGVKVAKAIKSGIKFYLLPPPSYQLLFVLQMNCWGTFLNWN